MRMFGILVVFGLAGTIAAGSTATTAPRPRVSLHAGEVRWLLPGRLQPGVLIRCVVHGHAVEARLPPLPAKGVEAGTDVWSVDRTPLQISRRSTGATLVACGDAPAAASHRATPPYVIGQNGLALIRGTPSLAALERTFGTSSPLRPDRAHGACRATWNRFGLRATFAGRDCTTSRLLRSATVGGAMWTSLNGIQVGDPVARMLWEVPGARLVASTKRRQVWLVSAAIASDSKLYAVIGPAGVVTSLECVVRR